MYILAGILARKLEGDLPNSRSGIRGLIFKFADDLREFSKQRIQQLKKDGEKFCVIFDECTSLHRKRYMNLTLGISDSNLMNLGLTALHGSMTAKRILETVNSRLSEFDLNLENDIISISTDGTAVMTCAGRSSPTHQQLCLAHGIQIAVIDVLYPKNKPNQEPLPIEEIETEKDLTG